MDRCSPTHLRALFRRAFGTRAEVTCAGSRAHCLASHHTDVLSSQQAKENRMNAKQILSAGAVSLALAVSTAYAMYTNTKAQPLTGK